ncbi:LOG family protein [Methyloligella solikamskensis]|uniref:Cytokinin riboside 5'-monophosphate phosphoribohydrolase n=1 Tax=Methyloligella solikamskensis TaxID=1177756 RepID=A0ABW3J985_9HYPH
MSDPSLQKICVYCGSGAGGNPAYAEGARRLGQIFAEAGIGLVYGGGCIGLMGEIARSVLEHGGHVTGIIPTFLTEREVMLKDVQELIVVDDMHQRKHLMFDKSDAFVALPGGLGTLEELVEQLTWSQLGRHEKPIVLADIENFWSPLLALFKHMQEDGFIRQGLELKVEVVDDVERILPTIRANLKPRPERAEEAAIDIKF